MLFTAASMRALTEGRLSATYRRWTVVRPKVGSRFTTVAGVVEVTSLDRVDEASLTESDAAEAGFETLDGLRAWTTSKGAGSRAEGDLYRIGLRLVGPDPRIALREDTALTDAGAEELAAKLERMDRAAEEPWTSAFLRRIEEQPGVVSSVLADDAGLERAVFKNRVRRLKALGLTESLEVGYRLSPRGTAFLERKRT